MDDLFDHRILREYSFGLIDASRVDQLPPGLALEALAPANLVSSAHLMPRLLVLRSLPEVQRHALLDSIHEAAKAGDESPVGLFVKTDADVKAFVRQWNAAQICEPKPGQKVWLRLHDPRVVHQLLRILTSRQRRQFFLNSQALTYWVGREWMTESVWEDISHEESKSAITAAVTSNATERVDWERIGRIGLINRALNGASVRDASSMTTQGLLAEQLMQRAGRFYGLTEPADLVEFAMRGLTTTSAFDEHPEIAAAINVATSPDDDSSLADRFAMMSAQVWANLGQSQQSQ